mgnify:CR=1 FL=1
MGFNILIADDKGSDINKAREIISKSLLANCTDNIFTCQFIKTKFNCPSTEKTFIELLPDIDKLDFAFVDLSWDDDKDFSNYSEGGKFIIKEIIDRKYFNCLIIPLTKEIGENISPEDQVFRFKSSNENLILESISKKADEISQVIRLNHLIYEKWLLPFISKIKDTSLLHVLLESLKNKVMFPSIMVDERKWKFDCFSSIFVQRKKDIEEYINTCLGFTFPKNIFNWANTKKQPGGRPSKSGFKKPQSIDLVEVYKHYISIDKNDNFSKTNEINQKAELILSNRVARLENTETALSFKELTISKVEIYSLSEKIPDSYFNLLIWRRVILGLNRHTILNSRGSLKTIEIYHLCTGKTYMEVSTSTLKNFFFFLGFILTKTGYIDPVSFESENCFPEENDWLSNLSYTDSNH